MIASIKHAFAPFWHLVEHYKSKGYVQINEFATNVYSTTLRQPFKICTHKNFYGAFFLAAKKIHCHDEYEVLEEAIIMLSLDWNLLLVE